MTPGIAVVWVGRRPDPPWEALAADYAGRVARLVPFADLRVRPAAGRDAAPARALAREAAAIARHLAPHDTVVALDERGRERTTPELAGWLEEQRRQGRRTVFVVGSDLGLAPGITARAAERLSLSRLTLPHALARLLLLEQLYRAFDLLAGGRYHRGGAG